MQRSGQHTLASHCLRSPLEVNDFSTWISIPKRFPDLDPFPSKASHEKNLKYILCERCGIYENCCYSVSGSGPKLSGNDSVEDPHHFAADPDPAFHLDSDPDPTFYSAADPDPTTHFFPDLDPPRLQNNPLKLPPIQFDAYPDPAFHSDTDPDHAFHFDADPGPAYKNYADPNSDPQHWIMIWYLQER